MLLCLRLCKLHALTNPSVKRSGTTLTLVGFLKLLLANVSFSEELTSQPLSGYCVRPSPLAARPAGALCFTSLGVEMQLELP